MIAATPEVMSERDRDALRKARQRAAAKDLQIPPCANPERRAAAEADVFLWLETYLSGVFEDPWTPSRRKMVEAIFRAQRTRTAKALAAPRGDGKTAITQGVTAYCICMGIIRYVVILAATGQLADEWLENLKHIFEENELLLEDYPEICIPVLDVAPSPQRAGSQTVAGELTHIAWCGDTVEFPKVKGSRASGIVVRARGITGTLRGMNHRGQRPDLVIIDDPDDEESADADSKIEKRVSKISKSIRGLAKGGKSLARVMLCTIINRKCVAYQYTDRRLNPAWNGERFRQIEKMPDREDLWGEYTRRAQEEWAANDEFARGAHRFYLENQAAMDSGAEIGNPYAFEDMLLEDGTQWEVSALQHCYNVIADIGWNAFRTEYQNDPPEESGPQDSGITEAIVAGTDPEYAGRVNGRERLIAPDDATSVTAFIDVHRRHLEWTVTAWGPGGTGSVVDYGVTATHQPDVVGEEEAIFGGLRELRDMLQTEPVATADGEPVPLAVCLVDCGYQPEAVYRFCRASGEPFHPAMGDPRFKRPAKATADKRQGGDWWYWSQVKSEAVGRIWVVNHFPDQWKHDLHNMLLTKPMGDDGGQAPGTLTLWGETARDHLPYAEQVCAEIWTTEFKDGSRGEKSYWHKRRRDNHWLDCTVGCLVGAAVASGPGLTRRKVRLSELRNARA